MNESGLITTAFVRFIRNELVINLWWAFWRSLLLWCLTWRPKVAMMGSTIVSALCRGIRCFDQTCHLGQGIGDTGDWKKWIDWLSMATKIMMQDPLFLGLQASNPMLTVSSIMTQSIERTIKIKSNAVYQRQWQWVQLLFYIIWLTQINSNGRKTVMEVRRVILCEWSLLRFPV